MKIEEKEFLLKTGEVLRVYCPTSADAQGLADNYNITAGESDNLSTGEGEMVKTPEDEIEWLKRYEDESNRSCVLVGAIDGKIVGIAEISQLSKKDRLKHRCDFGISIQKAHWRKGIATCLMKSLFDYAKVAGFEQVELEVVASNDAAYALYQKFGFEKTGYTKNGLKYNDGSYADLVYMIKTL